MKIVLYPHDFWPEPAGDQPGRMLTEWQPVFDCADVIEFHHAAGVRVLKNTGLNQPEAKDEAQREINTSN